MIEYGGLLELEAAVREALADPGVSRDRIEAALKRIDTERAPLIRQNEYARQGHEANLKAMADGAMFGALHGGNK